MKVFVAGGSGVVGERLIPRLIAAGHEVFATTRSQKGIEPLEILGANPLVVDGLDEEAVTKVVSLVRYRFLERLRGAGPQAAAVTDRRRHRRLVVIHVDDAAAATVLAVERGGRGVYNIVDDDPAAVSEWLPYLADVLGAKPPRRLPAWLGRLAAGEAFVSMSTWIRGSSNAKAKRELGWTPRWASWRDGFREALDGGSSEARPFRRTAA